MTKYLFNQNIYIDPHPTHINILIDEKRYVVNVEDEYHLQRLALNSLRAAMQLRKQKDIQHVQKNLQNE
tara:strand:- start:110 stop:316 length:207 start_codon:yes stop_codon:yes gene_type:complete